jgi:hypothetical protein
VNDVAPQVTSAATANVNEGVTAAYTITSSGDVDTTGEATVYSISGTDSGLFNVDSNTGAVTFKVAPDHEAAADSGGNNVYDIIVKASDGTNSTTKNVAITVVDLNDNAPVITSLATATVAENQTAAYDVNSTDADTVGGPTVYSISGGADKSLFSINSSTGVVSFIAAPNFEVPGDGGGDNDYDIIVKASDGTNSTTQAVVITVTDVNDVAPQVNSAATANVNEGVSAAYTITSTGDVDTTGETTVYSISGTDQALFNVDSSTGAVTFKVAPNHEAPADAGGNNVYDIVVKASDGTNSTTKNVAITVVDLNDTAPVFTSAATKTVNENQTAIMTVTTSDADTVGTNPATFTITGGADQTLFDITSNGVLTFKAAPDYETKADSGANGVYDVQVTASDGANTTIQNIAVTVADVNEAPTGVVVNLSSPNVSESNSSKLLVGSFTVTDDALGTESITLSGADASLLEISGGNIYIKAGVLLDHETNPTLDFIVNAQDLTVGGIVSSSAQSITITDAAPLLIDDNFISIAENTKVVGNVADATGDHSGIIYGISNSDDGALFAVDSAGNLSFIAAPDFENPLDVGNDNTYTVTVTADDGNGNLAAHAYTFDVTDVAGGTFNGNGSNNTLNGTEEADVMNGNGGDDTINGLAGNDIINGGGGKDTMNGGVGNDSYFVDNTGDKAIESTGQGTDTVNASVNFTLGVNVENLTFQGSSNLNGTGNTLDNILTGNTGNNNLNGGDGADTIIGGLGRDNMTGGLGNDTFDFNVIAESKLRPNHDTITDFTNGDLIDLSDIVGANAIAGQGGVVANSVSWALVSGNTIISIETTGNGVADMEIQLTGNKLAILDAGDFIL